MDTKNRASYAHSLAFTPFSFSRSAIAVPAIRPNVRLRNADIAGGYSMFVLSAEQLSIPIAYLPL